MTPEENARIADLEQTVSKLINFHNQELANISQMRGEFLVLLELYLRKNSQQLQLWDLVLSDPLISDEEQRRKLSRLLKLLKLEDFDADQFKTAIRNATVTVNEGLVSINEEIKKFPGLLSKLNPIPLIDLPASWSGQKNPGDAPAS